MTREQFIEIIKTEQEALRRFLLALCCGNRDEADDIAQDALVKAYLSLSKYEGTTWLYRIAYNCFYDQIRRNKVTEDIEQPVVARKGSQSVDSNLKMDLYNAMAILSESERSCVTLQLVEGQPIDKISEITGMAPGTVKSHLFRGKQKLATYLRNNGYDR